MKTLTNKEIQSTAKELRNITKTAKRKLFEFEVLVNLQELKTGKFDTFTSAKDLLKAVKK